MYDSARLLPIFTSILGEGKGYSGHEYYFNCPFCAHHKPKFAVNLAKGKWHCWKCGASGRRLLPLFKKLNVSKAQIAELRELLADDVPYYYKEKDTGELRLPEEYKPLWLPTDSIRYKHAVVYLKNRGITAGDILKHRIGYCEAGQYADRIIIPSYDSTGKLNYFVGRAFFDKMMPYLLPPVSKNIVGFENQIVWSEPVVLVEGVFDAIAVKRNVIPLFGKTLQSKLKSKLIEESKVVYVMLDKDASEEASRIAEDLFKNNIEAHIVQLESKDPSEAGLEKIVEAIHHSGKTSFVDILKRKMDN